MKIITIGRRNITQFQGMEVTVIHQDDQKSIEIYNALEPNRLIAGSDSFNPVICQLIESEIIGDLTDLEVGHVDIDSIVARWAKWCFVAISMTIEEKAYMALTPDEWKDHPMTKEMIEKGFVERAWRNTSQFSVSGTALWRGVQQVLKALTATP